MREGRGSGRQPLTNLSCDFVYRFVLYISILQICITIAFWIAYWIAYWVAYWATYLDCLHGLPMWTTSGSHIYIAYIGQLVA